MRQDQFEKLKALAERLIDIAIHDLDPSNWPGAGKAAVNLTAQERGDAYWTRKLATSTIGLAIRTHTLLEYVQDPGAPSLPLPAPGEDDAQSDLEADIRATEHQAARLMAKLQAGSSGKPIR